MKDRFNQVKLKSNRGAQSLRQCFKRGRLWCYDHKLQNSDRKIR